MRLIGVAVRVACVYLSLAGCVHGLSFSETSQDGSPDTAIAAEENHALARSSRMSWSFAASSGLQEQHGSPVVQFRTPNAAVSQERRALRNVHVSPDTIGNVTGGGTGGGGLSSAGLVIVVVSSVSLVLFVAVLVFWCCCTKKSDPEWRLLGSFKRRNPEIDEEELYAQAKGDTHLTGY